MRKTIYSQEHKKLIRILKKARLEAGLTQKEVAKYLGVTQSYISKFEAGQRKLDFLVVKKLSKIYKCSLTNLINSF